jgi:hypothetical protein
LQAILAEGDNVRTIVKFLSHEQSIEREEAVSLLLELSKSEALCEKIGSVNGAILILVGMISSKSENLSTVEKADKTLGNLEKCENNVRQMAENGRLRPLLNQILEGTSSELNVSMIFEFHASIRGVLSLCTCTIFFKNCNLEVVKAIEIAKFNLVFKKVGVRRLYSKLWYRRWLDPDAFI